MLGLYSNIKARRLELGLTQTELAQKMGYADKSMIAKIEKGLVDLPQSKIIAFAKVLDTNPGNLMGIIDADYEPNKPNTIAAHFDGDEYTEEELEEILQFAEFVKAKRK